MKRTLILVSALAFGLTTSVFADTRADANFIFDQHLIAQKTDEKWNARWDKTVTSIGIGMEALGGQIIDPVRFREELLGDFQAKFIQELRVATLEAYEAFFTPSQIKHLAAFYRTDEGQDMLSKGLTEETLNTHVGFFKDGPGAPMLVYLPELSAVINGVMPMLESRIEEMFSPARMADIFEMKEVVHFDDEKLRRDVVERLRAVN